MNTDAIAFWVGVIVVALLIAAEFVEAWLHRRDVHNRLRKWSEFK